LAKTSTNALTKRYCELEGWPHAKTEFFAGGRRHDLFGIADAIIFRPMERWVQNCSYGTVPEHQRKAKLSNVYPLIEDKLEFWEWKKKKGVKGHFLRRYSFWSGKWNTKPVYGWEGPIDV
jgi:hypothetical protein